MCWLASILVPFWNNEIGIVTASVPAGKTADFCLRLLASFGLICGMQLDRFAHHLLVFATKRQSDIGAYRTLNEQAEAFIQRLKACISTSLAHCN